MDLGCRQVDLAVSEYDERLFAANHPDSNTPTIFIKMSPFTDWLREDFGLEIAGQRCMPILAFPKGWPMPHEVVRKLTEIDSQRRGTALLREINDKNDRIRAQAAYVQSEAAGEVAEVWESMERNKGRTSHSTSYRKRDIKQRG